MFFIHAGIEVKYLTGVYLQKMFNYLTNDTTVTLHLLSLLKRHVYIYIYIFNPTRGCPIYIYVYGAPNCPSLYLQMP